MWAGCDYEWHVDLPDECPPPEAEPCDATVYRFVKNDPPTTSDFVRPVDNQQRSPKPDDDACEVCALSVFTDPADAATARNLVPGMRKRMVAQADLAPDSGVMKARWSPPMPSHASWWVPDGVDPSAKFVKVDL